MLRALVLAPSYRPKTTKRTQRKTARKGKASRTARHRLRDKYGHFKKLARRAAPRRAPKRGRSRAAARRARRALAAYTLKHAFRAQRRKGIKKHLRATRPLATHQRVAGFVRLNPRTGEPMSRSVARNPRRRRRNGRRTITVNPRKRRRRSVRRRNPRSGGRVLSNPNSLSGLTNLAKQSIVPMGMGALGGAATGFIDTKLAGKSVIVTLLAKLALGIGGAAALRKKPSLAMGWAGGVFGTIGYNFGIKMGGGLVATDKNKAIIGIGEMADADPAMAAMLAGLGDSVADVGDAASDYNSSLGDVVDDNMGDVVDDMGDVVDAYNQ